MVAAILRLYHIDYQSVWLDEIHTLNEANPQKSFSEVYESLLISEPHPPLYFFLVHVLFKIFGYTTLVARMFSALIGLAGVLSLYFLGKELFNRKVGIYATALVAINYFQIYYSQDARMYSLLFLTTTLSFIYLIKFIKSPSFKSAIIYSIMACLMIYSHFFALFVLVSQYVILLYFIIKPFYVTRKKFFIYTLISGIITTVLYLPTYGLIQKTTAITSIWIQMPELDVYTQFFKDFFGKSELVLFFVVILIVLFFVHLFKNKNTTNLYINPNDDKLVFSFIIIFVWVLTSLLLPLIRTYTSLPMLVNRYFIAILPAIILIVAIGLYHVKNEVVRYSIILIIIIFSFTDIVVVKKHYHSISKAQFREATAYIVDKNIKNHIVVSSLSWYLPFFLQQGDGNYQIVDSNLDDFVESQSQNKSSLNSFWYFDGHDRGYNPKPETIDFLNKNYTIQDNYNGFQAWTRHYVVKKQENNKVEFSESDYLKLISNTEMMSNIETYTYDNKHLIVKGWALLQKTNSKNTKIQLVILKNQTGTLIQTLETLRPDVTTYFKLEYNADNSGFESEVILDFMPEGDYKLGIWLKNEVENKEGLILSENQIKI